MRRTKNSCLLKTKNGSSYWRGKSCTEKDKKKTLQKTNNNATTNTTTTVRVSKETQKNIYPAKNSNLPQQLNSSLISIINCYICTPTTKHTVR